MQADDLGGTTTVSPIERSGTSSVAVDDQFGADHVGATQIGRRAARDRRRRRPTRGRCGRRCGGARGAFCTVSSRSHEDATWAANSRPAASISSTGRPGEHDVGGERLEPVSIAPRQRRHQLEAAAAEPGDQTGGAGDAAQERHHAVARRQRPVDIERGDHCVPRPRRPLFAAPSLALGRSHRRGGSTLVPVGHDTTSCQPTRAACHLP